MTTLVRTAVIIAALALIAAGLYGWHRLSPPDARLPDPGTAAELTASVDAYTVLSIDGPLRIRLAGGPPGLQGRGEQEFLNTLAIDGDAGKLGIGLARSADSAVLAEFDLRGRNVEEVHLSGASELVVTGGLARDVTIRALDATRVTISGECRSLTVFASGAAIVNAEDFKCSEISIEAETAAEVTAHGQLKAHVRARDAASITLHGRPADMDMDAAGLAVINDGSI